MSLMFGTLPSRDAFIRGVQEKLDPATAEPWWPQAGYEITFGADTEFYARLARAMNEGIDAHLEAVQVREDTVQLYGSARTRITILDPASMHTLLRRMLEHTETLECPDSGQCSGSCEQEQAEHEIGDILQTLGWEWT